MITISRKITNTMLIRADEVDGMVLLRARWEKDDDSSTVSSLVRRDEADDMVRRIRDPLEMRSATIDVLAKGGGWNEAQAILVKGDADLGRLRLINDPFVHIRGMDENVPEGTRAVFLRRDDLTYYDQGGNLLNSTYQDSVCEQQYELKALLDLSDRVDWLKIPERYTGGKIYHVPGNGYSISLIFDLTPDEYREAIIRGKTWDRIDNILRVKGEDPEQFRAPDDDNGPRP